MENMRKEKVYVFWMPAYPELKSRIHVGADSFYEARKELRDMLAPKLRDMFFIEQVITTETPY